MMKAVAINDADFAFLKNRPFLLSFMRSFAANYTQDDWP